MKLSWSRMVELELAAAINKGLSGMEEKEAIGVTSLAEGMTCLVSISVYAIRGQENTN
jgi:hypothetical protein